MRSKDRKKLEETHGKDWRGFTPWSGHVSRGLDGYMNEATFAPGTPKDREWWGIASRTSMPCSMATLRWRRSFWTSIWSTAPRRTHRSSRCFAAAGGKLLRLVFPRTEVQAYDNTAVLYTTYEMDLQAGGKPTTERGVATEVFVRRDGDWINTGWQLARTGK